MTVDEQLLAVRPLRRDDGRLAASLTARAMRDNPTGLALHGPDPLARLLGLTLLWAPYFHARSELHLGAYHRGLLVGVACATRPGACIGTTPPRAGAGSAGTPAHAFEDAYRAHDLPAPHWHVAPVAVEPGLQGRGVGAALMAGLHRHFDEQGATAWCETDLRQNVDFYEANGWTVADRGQVAGVALWWLRRDTPAQP